MVRIITNHAGHVLYSGTGATMRDVVEVAIRAGANLNGADLRGADLRGADLRRARLRDADLRDAGLSGADLSGADLNGADLRRADLNGADLRGADLRGADLSGANLNGADLSGANLRDAHLNGAALVGARPVLTIGPIGSRADYLTALLTDHGIRIATGCFSGTRDEFAVRVEREHGTNPHGEEYRAALVLIDAHARLWSMLPNVGK